MRAVAFRVGDRTRTGDIQIHSLKCRGCKAVCLQWLGLTLLHGCLLVARTRQSCLRTWPSSLMLGRDCRSTFAAQSSLWPTAVSDAGPLSSCDSEPAFPHQGIASLNPSSVAVGLAA